MGLTQEELGEKFSYTKQSISMWETGKRPVPFTMYKTISDFLGITIDELYAMEAKGRETMIEKEINNCCEKDFAGIKTPEDAAVYLDSAFEDFKVDPSNEVTLKGLLRNYLIMLLLYTTGKKEEWLNPLEEDDKTWDVGWYISEIFDVACNQLLPARYAELGYLNFEGEGNVFERCAGRFYNLFEYTIMLPEPGTAEDTVFRIHLFEFISHLKRKTGVIDHTDRYYAAF